ncbi:hypothetical protein [Propionibacterium australiense]|nr:hypothetical protein [Propionibacterium australiense]
MPLITAMIGFGSSYHSGVALEFVPCAQGFGAVLIAGAFLGGGASIIDQACSGYPINWGQVGKDSLFGMIGGGFGYGIGKGIQWAAKTPVGKAATDWASRQANKLPVVRNISNRLGANSASDASQAATNDALKATPSPSNNSPAPRPELPPAPARPQIEPPTKTGPDFIADDKGTVVPTSRTRLEEGFQSAGLDTFSTDSPGTGYILPDGSKVRVMDATPYAPQRAMAVMKRNRILMDSWSCFGYD